jgi:phosphoglycolate phosphatase-like HAD superfamily hydrolase
LFITRGSNGSLVIDENGIEEIPGLMILSKVDTVGAGDSYLAGVTAALAAGYDMKTAACLGSYVAGVTVQKLFQTGTATPEEIMEIGVNPDYIYAPDLAENIRQATYLPDSEIEIIREWKEKLNIRYAIFDHDGTISTLREGWELIMAPMMVKAILGDKYKDAGTDLYSKVEERVNEYIDKTTGIQTLVQMKGLLDIIREFGYVPEKDMLDEFGYKKIYNDELLEMVRARERKFANGELSIDDLTIKNAIPFVKKLYEAGVRLYLASGTDENDVREEARTLGYDHLFEGGIFGAVGDVTIEAKKIVLNRIMEKIGGDASAQVVTFGDGPVEIRETRKRGGLTVGLATNELRRYELNPKKRARLIKAGADVVIPDFSLYSKLLALMNIN